MTQALEFLKTNGVFHIATVDSGEGEGTVPSVPQ